MKCPYCREEIQDGAIKCKHCQSMLEAQNVFSNTSGLGDAASVPDEIKGWNWGAFIVTPIWGIGNKSYFALLALIPILNVVMPFIAGAKGNEWAWRNKQWQSIDQFRATQKKWIWWSLGITVTGIFLYAASKS